MADPIETVKTFVREDNTATIVCPSCSTVKIVSVAAYREKCHFLKVRCACGSTFRIHLNFRQFYRKTTELPGTYRCIKPPGGGGGPMIVQDISRGGVGLRISGTHNLRKGYILSLSFNLDDKKNTPLNKEVCIQSIHDNMIGCRFSGNQPYEKELGFYMQS
jgi:hypothetical protein